MNVVLVNPTYFSRLPMGFYHGEPPLGLAYIAAVIERDTSHHVEIIDSIGLMDRVEKKGQLIRVGLPEEDLVEMIVDRAADIIGITLMSTLNEKEILHLAGSIKRVHPHTPIVLGGAHATLEWERCLANPAVDYIVCGEGEVTIIELLDALSHGRSVAGIQGIAFRDPSGGRSVKTENRPPVDINSLPLPARHLLPMHNYFKHQPSQYYLRPPAAAIITSRACPFNCLFCSTVLVWGKKYRGRKPEDVVNEIETLVRDYSVREILINDDCFLADKERVLGICEEIIRRKIDISYQIQAGVNVQLLDENLLKKLRDSGLYAIVPEFETGNPATLKYIRKSIDLEKGKKMIACANRLGLWTKTNIIIGFPHETADDIERSVKFATSIDVDVVNFLLPIPFSHTDMGKDYRQLGLLKTGSADQVWACDSLHFSVQELERIRKQAIARFNIARMKRFLKLSYIVFDFLPKVGTIERLSLLIRRMFFGLVKFVYYER
jgi:anaerobic magnesium-protoporphyrin IX monomethyl ester cyclase